MDRKVHRNGIAPPQKPTGGSAWAASRWLLPPWLAAAVTLSAFGLYLLFLSYSYMIDYDFYVWVEGAKTLRQEGIGAVGKVYKEPLLSLLLNLVAPIFGGNYEGAGKAISLLSGSIAIGLVFLLAYELFGSRLLALLAALLVAVHPQIIYYSTHPFSEALYLCLIMLAMLCFWRAHQGGSLPVAVASGVVLGLAFLTRIPGIATVLTLLLLSFATLAAGRFQSRPAMARCAAVTLGFLLLAGPYWISIHSHTGQWRLSNKVDPNVLIREAYSAYDPAQKVENYERLLYGADRAAVPEESGLFTSFLRHPLPMLTAYRHQLFLGLQLAHFVFPLALVVLGLIVLMCLAWGGDEARKRGIVYLSMLAPFFAYPLGHVELRYMAPLIPVFVLLALEGTRWAGSYLPKLLRQERTEAMVKRAGLALSVTAAVVILAWSGRELAAYLQRTPWSEPIELQQAGLWLKTHTAPDAVIMARKPMPAFYAERSWVPLPYTDYEGLLRSLREQRVSFLVMDEIFAGRLRPQLRFLLYEPDRIRALTELVPVHVLSEQQGRAVIIYQVIQERLPSSPSDDGTFPPR
ncbi:glycosyltransferase family 39 protein [Candidatus Methylomirabilis sp.]|uniref:ArnT family glycosyltransferase n=1 Tax=Candidatus Methylomirabilis sp. TaxID=2032687 RepID=UPI002A5D33F9|nr:glycosyltransferase family 39 protein [Candidatus Methylomirabilis sp.]